MNLSGLRPYQRDHAMTIARSLLENRATLDASDTGTGKTFVSLWLARELGLVPLVICPKSVVIAWRDAAAAVGAQIEITNYEKIRGRRSKVRGTLARSDWGHETAVGTGSRWTWGGGYRLMIFDEVDRCAGLCSLNSKLLIAARRQADYVLALSATAASDPRELKALGFALGLFTLPRFHAWLLRNGCKPGLWGGFDFTGGPSAMADIHDQIFKAGRGARMRKEEIPGFPRTRIDSIPIPDETGEAAKAAAELREAYRDGNDLAHLTALRQKLELLKVPYLAEMAEHHARTSKVIVFANYRATIAALEKALGGLAGFPPVIDGDNTQAEREDIKARFQRNEIPILLANVQAGGVGIGLHDPTGQVERTTLFPPCYSARAIKQLWGRVQRDGGGFSTQLWVYFADTVEAAIAATVCRKLSNMDALNDAILNGQL